MCVCAKLLWLCLTLCDPMDWHLPGSSVHGILQARMLEWVAVPFSRGSSWPRDQTHISCVSCLSGGFFTTSATWEAHLYIYVYLLPLGPPSRLPTPPLLATTEHWDELPVLSSRFPRALVKLWWWTAVWTLRRMCSKHMKGAYTCWKRGMQTQYCFITLT